MNISYVNGEFLPADQALIPFADLGLIRGYGVFDFFRFKTSTPLFLDQHIDRLLYSASRLQLNVNMSREALHSIVHSLIEKNDVGEGGIQLFVTGGIAPDGYTPANPSLLGMLRPVPAPPPEWYQTGIKLHSVEFLRELPDVKTTNYIVPIMLQKEVKKTGAQDVLYHKNGQISESARSNFFIIRNGILITPDKDVLKGITRGNLLKIAPDVMKVETRPVSFQETLSADEAFLTSTSKGILPVVKIDDHVIGTGKPGAATGKLAELLESFAQSVLADVR